MMSHYLKSNERMLVVMLSSGFIARFKFLLLNLILRNYHKLQTKGLLFLDYVFFCMCIFLIAYVYKAMRFHKCIGDLQGHILYQLSLHLQWVI